ncbi:endoplasmic reticulum junction formation protein lunapark-B-like isoform X1 [Acipenser ruthenus]|uniref:endoplasmic reticulum junction formation protein lunapark-B-like isoform X1 n=1 Tax=Acipenser ruthenus TaxID=7906 RepID=UPI00145B0FED|nr:endoplasmic reticulum junction formation protein lunapark-B-like isoform X1 [Acipenser ruthenus]XP_033900868.1 endoplasmic reticulum junction formation protein lunapark-B-like isoform X1 [Acipenser ruthenus]
MGAVVSRWRAKPSTVDVLECIDKNIQKLEEFRETNQRLLKLWVGRLLLHSSLLYLLTCMIVYIWYLPEEWTAKLIMALPFFVFPILIWFLRKMLIWMFSKRTERNSEKLEELKAQKKKILEEVMEKETYKTAKLILERFDPDSKKKNEQELAAVAGPPVTPRPGQELRQRNVSQKNPVPATPINPNQGVPHPPATPSAPSPTSAPGGPPERTLAMAAAQQNLMRRSMSPGTPVPGMGPNSMNTQVHDSGVMLVRLHPPGPPLARAILPRERGVMDRVVEFLVGDGPQNRYALVCQQCFSHNGMALKEEFEYVAFRCAYCYFLNPARKTRPQAPRLPDFSFERRPCTDSQTSGVSAETGVSENQPSAVPLEEARQEGKPVDTDTAERDAQASDEKQTPQVEEQKPLENAEAEQEEVSFMKTE